ncbi:alpha/beta hydrolase family protein [Microbulbifer hydrolyticus]|uniref:Alpha/beta fold hydrolase n=1 Tax=Microbulbifer hydrolyticus TaxID=48074 RepID=A0A6P1T8S9_9GAMM|nr:alpha/beta fold hydrolase [Microbulbifer hydrolyticus]MBB5211268.1 dipeptidyl aminopeptidase/acylaminoacyl peptidase [Microbulbifer hydrolyticus]QHQ37966.1 alpha/beta fold hydrolase [Microbulbifer hydrolyticus]
MRVLIVLLLLCLCSSVRAFDVVDTFGGLPAMKDFQISPNGKTMAYLRENEGRYYAVAQRMDENKSPVIFGFEESEIRSLEWVSDSKILLRVSEAYYSKADSERFTIYRLGIWDVDDNDITWAFNGPRYKHNISAPKLVSKILNEDKYVLLSYYYREVDALFRINLETGKREEVFQGKNINHWMANEDGDLIFYRKYDKKMEQAVSMVRGAHEDDFSPLMKMADGELQIFPEITVGVSEELDRVYYVAEGEQGVDWFLAAPVKNGVVGNGVVLGPLGDRGYDINSLVYDYHSSILSGYGVILDVEEFRFLAPELSQVYADLRTTFEGAEVELTSYTQDRSRFVARISGSKYAEEYYLYDQKAGKIQFLGSGYQIKDKNKLGRVTSFSYQARDGLEISAYLTVPLHVEGELPPLIVMPHGGPESRDSKSFDWKRQAYASAGYAVFQPNFRGSSGFGTEFAEKGYGEWGQKMQSDVNDGVEFLVKERLVDPEKICVVGSSYGGYVALFSAVQYPEIYQCSVSFAGISVLSEMHLHAEEQMRGLSYWKKSIGDRFETDELSKYSPLDLVNKDAAPTLLFHGDMDTVVPLYQSEKMAKRLKALRVKNSEFIQLDGEDHWLSKGSSREVFLAKSLDFIRENIQ